MADAQGGRFRFIAQCVLLIAVPLGLLLIASISALLIVRVAADLRLGLDPLMAEASRPRLPLSELASRSVATDLLRQLLLVVLVIAMARWSEGPGWAGRLALSRPVARQVSFGRLWLLMTIWPILHIAWVTATAQVLQIQFGRGTHLSPFLSPYAIAGWFAYVALMAPLAEELLMRGEAFARARRFMRPAGAIVATALLFAFAHLTPAGLAQPISLLPLAFVLGWLRWRTGRLWPGILLHAWSNLALVGYLLWPGTR